LLAHSYGGFYSLVASEKMAPFLGPSFEEANLVGRFRKGYASYRSASRNSTSGKVWKRRE
jgi:hypothetical protein